MRNNRITRSIHLDRTYDEMRRDDDVPSGASCVVITDPEDSTKVIKIYRNAEDCKSSYLLQKFFSKKGLAPKTYGIVRVHCKFGGSYLGLISQKVSTIRYDSKKGYPDIDKLSGSIKPKVQELINRFRTHMCDIGYSQNIGIMNGNPVFIDFGMDTLSVYGLRRIIKDKMFYV